MSAAKTTEQWVAQINRLAREIDELADSLHPSAWPEQLKDYHERFRREAGRRTT